MAQEDRNAENGAQRRVRDDDHDRYQAWRNKASSTPPHSLQEFNDRGEDNYVYRGATDRGHQSYPSQFYEGDENIGTHSGNHNVRGGEFGTWIAPMRQYRDMGERHRNERPPFHGVGPRNYIRRDERILEEVCDWLADDGELDASEVEVTVEKGEVRLAGSVPDRWSKRRAEDICYGVRGVVDVQNGLRIRKA